MSNVGEKYNKLDIEQANQEMFEPDSKCDYGAHSGGWLL